MQETHIANAVQPGDWAAAQPRAQYSALERVDAGDDWFEVYRVEDGVYCIYEPGNFQEVISYLTLGTQRALLQDTGMGMGDMAALVRRLTPLPVTAVNTHCHFDHVGRNWQFADGWYWPSRPSRASAQNGQGHAALAQYVAPGCNSRPYPADFVPEQYAIRPYPAWKELSEGQLFALGGRTLRVLHTPGHSPDSVMLADDERRLLFTGDTFYPAPLYTHMTSEEGMDANFAQFRATLHSLAQRYGGYTLYTSHNEPRRPGSVLQSAADAFDAAANGRAAYASDADGLRRYEWNGIAVVTGPGGPGTVQA